MLKVTQAVKEAQARLAQTEPSVLQAARELQAIQDPQVLLDLQVILAAQGLLDLQEAPE